MKNFQEISPSDRKLFIAKLYNHIWYDADRFKFLNEVLMKWEEKPSKEVKFMNESFTLEDKLNIL
jgi:hypothetical protein